MGYLEEGAAAGEEAEVLALTDFEFPVWQPVLYGTNQFGIMGSIDMNTGEHRPQDPGYRMESYRFSWRGSFDGTFLIAMTRFRDDVTLRVEDSAIRHAPPRIQRVPIPISQWEALMQHVVACDFWCLPEEERRAGLDGAHWEIERGSG